MIIQVTYYRLSKTTGYFATTHNTLDSTIHNQWLEDRLVWKLWPKRTQSIWIPNSESHAEYLTKDTFPSLRDLSWSNHLLVLFLQMVKFKKKS